MLSRSATKTELANDGSGQERGYEALRSWNDIPHMWQQMCSLVQVVPKKVGVIVV